MFGYLVFGDPRSAEDRVVYAGELPVDGPFHVGDILDLTLAEERFPSMVICNGTGEGRLGTPAFLVDQEQPTLAIHSVLRGTGLTQTHEAPGVEVLPFKADVILLVGNRPHAQHGIHVLRGVQWLNHPMVAGQRGDIRLETNRHTSVTCLLMENRPGLLPLAVFLVGGQGTVEDEEWEKWVIEEEGFQLVPYRAVSDHDLLALMSAVARFETKVEYVLGAPLVVGVETDAIRGPLTDHELAQLPLDVRQDLLHAEDHQAEEALKGQ